MKLIKVSSGKGTMALDKIIEKTKEVFMSEDCLFPFFDMSEIAMRTPRALAHGKQAISEHAQETPRALARAFLDIDEINVDNIYEKSKEILKNNIKPIFLMDYHPITSQIAKAFAEVYPENPGIVIFDAHPDANNNLIGKEDLLCYLVNQNIIKKENILLVGTRNWNKNEIEFIQKNRIKNFPMKEIIQEGLHEISESLMSVAKNFKALYISIDIDVLDPAFAPATNCQEPGGLTTRELLFFLHRLKKLKNLKAFDLAEINPVKDINDATSKVGAKILVELG